MCNRFTRLKCKEVVNVCDGARLGFVCDLELDVCTGQVVSLIVPGAGKCFGHGKNSFRCGKSGVGTDHGERQTLTREIFAEERLALRESDGFKHGKRVGRIPAVELALGERDGIVSEGIERAEKLAQAV